MMQFLLRLSHCEFQSRVLVPGTIAVVFSRHCHFL
nr:MAG TPA: hypothetical protein [Caudoviricetes sp.]DAP20223.1 MAG TPA: hypothetical protein [Caudoviricetes sp.]